MSDSINSLQGQNPAYIDATQLQQTEGVSQGLAQTQTATTPAQTGTLGASAPTTAFSPTLTPPTIDPAKAAVLLIELEMNETTQETASAAQLIKSNQESMNAILQLQQQQLQDYNNEVSKELQQQKQAQQHKCHGFFGCLMHGFKDLFTGHIGAAFHDFTQAAFSGGPVSDLMHLADKEVGKLVGKITGNTKIGDDVDKVLDFKSDITHDPMAAIKTANKAVGTVVGDITGNQQIGDYVSEGLGALEQVAALIVLTVATGGAGDAAVAADAAVEAGGEAAGKAATEGGEMEMTDLSGKGGDIADAGGAGDKPDIDNAGDKDVESKDKAGEDEEGQDDVKDEGEGPSSTDDVKGQGDEDSVEDKHDKDIHKRQKNRELKEARDDLFGDGSDDPGDPKSSGKSGTGKGNISQDVEIEMQEMGEAEGPEGAGKGEGADKTGKSDKAEGKDEKTTKKNESLKNFKRIATTLGGLSQIDKGVNDIENAIENYKAAQTKAAAEKDKAGIDYDQALYDRVDASMEDNIAYVKNLTKSMAPRISDALSALDAFAAANTAPME
jgi:hypothetical protein